MNIKKIHTLYCLKTAQDKKSVSLICLYKKYMINNGKYSFIVFELVYNPNE
jgi:hypothetical protein